MILKGKTVSIVWIVMMLSVGMAAAGGDFPNLTGPYFGQSPPRHEAEVFLDGVISTEMEPQMNAAFTGDGREFLFCAQYGDDWAIFTTREKDGRWLEPVPVFTSEFTDRDFTMAPDGRRILFGSDRPREQGGTRLSNLDIVVSTRTPDGHWSEPINIGPTVNTDSGENYPSVATSGNLYYFSCREGGVGGCDLYVSAFSEGRYEPPENLGEAVNSVQHDWDAFIAPDESYIIFSSQDRADTLGAQDLYISYRRADGGWTTARNMGGRVNSSSDEICPSVSLDGSFLFFTSRRRGTADIYWITADIIDEMRP